MGKIDKNKYYHRGEYKGTSGGEIFGYWNFRPMLVDRDDMWQLTLEIEKLLPANIIGLEFWGAVAVGYLSGALKPNYKSKFSPILWRKKPDKTGRIGYGYLDLTYPIYILDDVLTTGKSILPIIEGSVKDNYLIKAILVLKNRSPFKFKGGIPIREVC